MIVEDGEGREEEEEEEEDDEDCGVEWMERAELVVDAGLVVEGTVGGLLKHQCFDGSFPASDAMCMAVTGKGLEDIVPNLRNLAALQGLSDDQIMSVLVAAYFEKHFGGQLDVWESAVARVGDVVPAYSEKVKVVLDMGVVA